MNLEAFVRALADVNKELEKRGIESLKILSVNMESTSSLVPSGGATIPLLSGYIDKDGNFVETYRVGQEKHQLV